MRELLNCLLLQALSMNWDFVRVYYLNEDDLQGFPALIKAINAHSMTIIFFLVNELLTHHLPNITQSDC